MPVFRLRIAVAMLLVAVGWRAHAAPLSLDDALRLAEQRSAQLPAEDAAADAARQSAVAAGQRPDPVLKAGVSNVPLSGSERFSLSRDGMTMRQIGLMQEWTRSEKLQARSARFEREADAAQARRTLALANLQRDTAVAWLDRYYQERALALLLTQRDEAQLLVDAAEASYRGGRGAQADAFAARSGVALAEDRIAQVQRQVATATTQLARWIGSEATQPLGVAPNINAVPLDAQTLQSTLSHYPQIELASRQEDIARAEVEIARTAKRADWSSELMYGRRGSGYSDMVSFTVSIPLQWDQAHRQDRELAAKIAQAEQAGYQREDLEREYAATVRATLQEWQGERERVQRYEDRLVPLAEQRKLAALTAYRGGSGTLSSVLDARRAYIDTRMSQLQLAMNAARLWAQLNFLIPVRRDAAAAVQP